LCGCWASSGLPGRLLIDRRRLARSGGCKRLMSVCAGHASFLYIYKIDGLVGRHIPMNL
jgi:hypothetical protein